MNVPVEATSGGVGIVLGVISETHPQAEWFNYSHEVWMFLWPIIYGGLMAFGAHITKRIIKYYSNKKNKKENETT